MVRDKIHTRTVKGTTHLGVAVTGPHAGYRVYKVGVKSLWQKAGKATAEELGEAFEHTNATTAERLSVVLDSVLNNGKAV